MWLVIIAAIIVTFVFWGTQGYGPGRDGGGPGNYGTINGQRVTKDDYFNAQREVYLRYFFSYGDWPDASAKQTGFDVGRETYFRLLLIQKEKDFGIQIGPEAVATVAGQMLRSLKGGYPIPLNEFVKQFLQPRGLSTDDFTRFIRHDLGIQQLMVAAGLSGQLVTPQEVRALYEREHEELSAEAVFFSASNYLASVSLTNDAVAQFYTNRMADYRLKQRVQVAYVRFNVTNLLAQAEQSLATNLTELVEANARQLGTNLFGGAKSLEESKARIRETLIRRQALGDARRKANDFATKLLALEPPSVDNLERLARTNELTVSVSAPFDREEGPKDLVVGPNFTKAAFGLSTSEPFAGPLDGEDGAYVIAMNKLLPEEIPPLDSIRDRVVADFKYSEAVLLARTAGEAFFKAMTNSLAQGKKFTEICSDAKVLPTALPPFSISTQALQPVEDHVSLAQFKQAAFSVAYGKPNEYVPTREGGFVVFVRLRLPLNETRMKEDLPGYTARVRQTRLNEAFNLWFSREAQTGLRDTPIARATQAPPSGAPGE